MGRHWIAVSRAGVLAIDRAESPIALVGWLGERWPGTDPAAVSAVLERAASALAGYLDGSAACFAVPTDTRWASPFDQEVWAAVGAIPYGTTASYAEVAASIGRPRAARAVGSSLARCPLSPVVPCHRVIHANGDIGGWGADLTTKRSLLRLEATSSASPPPPMAPTRRPAVPSR
jgi:O-6-methylguanine DNA methyltransferase